MKSQIEVVAWCLDTYPVHPSFIRKVLPFLRVSVVVLYVGHEFSDFAAAK